MEKKREERNRERARAEVASVAKWLVPTAQRLKKSLGIFLLTIQGVGSLGTDVGKDYFRFVAVGLSFAQSPPLPSCCSYCSFAERQVAMLYDQSLSTGASCLLVMDAVWCLYRACCPCKIEGPMGKNNAEGAAVAVVIASTLAGHEHSRYGYHGGVVHCRHYCVVWAVPEI